MPQAASVIWFQHYPWPGCYAAGDPWELTAVTSMSKCFVTPGPWVPGNRNCRTVLVAASRLVSGYKISCMYWCEFQERELQNRKIYNNHLKCLRKLNMPCLDSQGLDPITNRISQWNFYVLRWHFSSDLAEGVTGTNNVISELNWS